jgi:hypothetical protein
MLSIKAERRALMRLARKSRRAEGGFVVARPAIASRRSRRELSFMRIVMTIRAACVRNGTAEIRIAMALGACKVGVLPLERKGSRFVIEPGAGPVCLPPGSGVARVATRPKFCVLKRSPVRIVMTGPAASEGHSGEVDWGLTAISAVTFLTADVRMQSRQREFCLCVRKSRSGTPRVLYMAVCACGSEFPRVRILVARCALAPQAQEGVVQVLHFYLSAPRRGDLWRTVAFGAWQLGMRALQGETGFGFMIELRRIETDERNPSAVVLQVAAGAIRLISGGVVPARMQSGSGHNPLLNFRVALETLELARAQAEVVTSRAVRDSIQIVVGS